MNFEKQVNSIISSIPKGKVSTYGLIAEAVRHEKACRAVGNVLHSNICPETIPCHRVVTSKGRISSAYRFGGLVAQRAKLQEEGIKFKNADTIDNLGNYLYIPKR